MLGNINQYDPAIDVLTSEKIISNMGHFNYARGLLTLGSDMTSLKVDLVPLNVPLSGSQEKWTSNYYFRQETYLAVIISAIAIAILTAISIFAPPRNYRP